MVVEGDLAGVFGLRGGDAGNDWSTKRDHVRNQVESMEYGSHIKSWSKNFYST